MHEILNSQNKPNLVDCLYEYIVKCDNYADRARAENKPREEKAFRYASQQMKSQGSISHYKTLTNLNTFLPTPEEFLDGQDFLAGELEIWDSVREKFYECNPDIITGEKPVHQVLDGGSLGAGKSVSMYLNCIYRMTCLSMFKDIHTQFNLQSTTSILFSLIGDGITETKLSLFEPARDAFIDMDFTQKFLQYDHRKIESGLYLNNKIVLRPQTAGSKAGRKGLANFFVGLDEMNHQPVINKSRRSDAEEGKYDQALLNYETMLNRCQSRFAGDFFTFWMVYLAGSARHTDDAMDQLERSLKEKAIPGVKIFNLAQWEAKPKHTMSKETFKFCVGNDLHLPHVIKDGETITDTMQFFRTPPPINYYDVALINPARFQRDQGGLRTSAITPFIPNSTGISLMFKEYPSILKRQNLVLGRDRITNSYFEIDEASLPSLEDRKKPHFIHTDLSKNTCRTAISMICLDGHVKENGQIYPRVKFRFIASIDPQNSEEIKPGLIRNLIKELRDIWGFNIQGVSYDSYGSTESIQDLTDSGFNACEISTVRTPKAYDDLKAAIDGTRIEAPQNIIAKMELTKLEEETNGSKRVIVHGTNSTKDISDTLAGCVHFVNISGSWATMRLHNQNSNYSEKRFQIRQEELAKLDTAQQVENLSTSEFFPESYERPLRPYEREDDWDD